MKKHSFPGVNHAQVFLLLLLTIFLTEVFSQSPNRDWVATYNGPEAEENADFAVDGDGNVYVCGYSNTPTQGYDIAVIKYTPTGTELWAKTYNGPANGNDKATAMTVDGAGNVFVAGSSAGTLTGLDWITLVYSPDGTLIASAVHSGSMEDVPTAIAVDAAHHVYVAGYVTVAGEGKNYLTLQYNLTNFVVSRPIPGGLFKMGSASYNGAGNGDDVINALTLDGEDFPIVTGKSRNAAGNDEIVTFRYDIHPNVPVVSWKGVYNNPSFSGNDIGNDVIADAEGVIYVSGSTQQSASNSDYVTIKYFANDAGGATSSPLIKDWAVTYNGSGNNDEAYSMVVYPSITGLNNSPDTSNIPPTLANPDPSATSITVTGRSINGTNVEYHTVTYDSTGNELWAKTFSTGLTTSSTDLVKNKIALDLAGNTYVSGEHYNGANSDFAIIRYSTTGHEDFVETYDGYGLDNGTDRINDISVDLTGSIYVAGQSWGGSNYDVITVKYSQLPGHGIFGYREILTINGKPCQYPHQSCGQQELCGMTICTNEPVNFCTFTPNSSPYAPWQVHFPSCTGAYIQWTFPGSSIPSVIVSNASNTTAGADICFAPYWKTTGTYSVSVKYYNPICNDCHFPPLNYYEWIIPVTVFGPNLTVTPNPAALCQNGSVQLVANVTTTAPPVDYLWSTGQTTSSISVSSAGIYSVIVSDQHASSSSGTCTNTATVTVVSGFPTITSISGASTICAGSCTSLSGAASGGAPGYTYTWSPTNGLSDPLLPTTQACPSTTTTYTLTATDVNGCTATASSAVAIIPSPTVTIGPITSLCITGNSTLTAAGGVTYVWSPGGQTTTSIVVPTTATGYTVTGTGTNGCTSSVATFISTDCPDFIYEDCRIFLDRSVFATYSSPSLTHFGIQITEHGTQISGPCTGIATGNSIAYSTAPTTSTPFPFDAQSLVTPTSGYPGLLLPPGHTPIDLTTNYGYSSSTAAWMGPIAVGTDYTIELFGSITGSGGPFNLIGTADCITPAANCVMVTKLAAPDASKPVKIKQDEITFSVYPNPANNNIMLSYSLPENQVGIFELYDVFGNLCLEDNISSNKNNATVNTSSLNHGIYYCRITIGKNVSSVNKLIIAR